MATGGRRFGSRQMLSRSYRQFMGSEQMLRGIKGW